MEWSDGSESKGGLTKQHSCMHSRVDLLCVCWVGPMDQANLAGGLKVINWVCVLEKQKTLSFFRCDESQI